MKTNVAIIVENNPKKYGDATKRNLSN